MTKEFEIMMKKYRNLEKEIEILDDKIKNDSKLNRSTDSLTILYNRKVDALNTLGEKIRYQYI